MFIKPAHQAEIDQHWADVRAGIYKSQPHLYRGETVAAQIERHIETAKRLNEQADWNMREATRLRSMTPAAAH